MLLFFASLAAAPPIAVDVAGMEPQLAVVRRDVAERGWGIGCEGRSGEERVIRIVFPAGTSEAAIDAYFDPYHHLGSSFRYYRAEDPPPRGCDREPSVSGSSTPWRVLAIGPREMLEPLVPIARSCGFAAAAVRSRRDGDLSSDVAVPPEASLVLDAGEDAGSRSGPTLCFLQMGNRMSAVTTTRTP